MRKRSVILLTSLLFAFSGIIARLYRLTEQNFATAADVQSTVTVTLATARGTLYDRKLQRLTNADTEYVAGVIPQPTALAALADSGVAVNTDGKPTVLRADTSFPLVDGIRQFTVPKRYGENTVAAHLIGYVGEGGTHGVSGAELALDDRLCETAGHLKVTYRTDGAGRVLTGGEVTVDNTLARANAGAALTIDRELQHTVEVLAGEQLTRGAVVVLEVNSGHVLAAASFPNYRPSHLADYLDRDDSPLFNRTAAAYNCGSVFKTVTAMAALEHGVPLTQTFTCTGALQVGANRIKCHHVLGHGTVAFSVGYAQSCNPYFIQLAHLTGGGAVYRYASLMGFDSSLILAEGWQTSRATLPTETDLSQSTLLANVSIGQGDLLATPFHVAAMTACVAGGGVYRRPTLYLGTVDELGILTPATAEPASRVCSAQTAATLREMMCEVVTDGTGEDAAPAVYTAGGKTGTAQTGWKTEDGDTMVHSWFTGFYPAEDPQYVITVLAEDADTTGDSTAPVFKIVCDQLYRRGYIKSLDKP